MFEIASFGAQSPADKQDKALANAAKGPPKGVKPRTPAEARAKRADARASLIKDLVATTKACQKAGIDIRDPMIRASLIASGGSAMALASRIGPDKTAAAINHFTMLAKKHGPYIKHLERNYMEMRGFSMQLRHALGPTSKKTKKAVEKSASVGAWGLVLALGALGAAVFFVVKSFAKSTDSAKEKAQSKPMEETTIDVQLKDAASKKYIPAKKGMKMDKEGVITFVYTGELKDKPFRVEAPEGHIPVWSGLAWKIMPNALAEKVVVEETKVAGFGAKDIHPKDAKGIESCGSLEEIVGYSFVGRAVKQRAVSPPMTIKPDVIHTVTQIRSSMPADRRYSGAVVNRRWPVVWPGSRGSYSYNP